MELNGLDLSLRDKGEKVLLLHREIQALGLPIPEEELRGRLYGFGTSEAFSSFQKEHGLAITGVVDERTVSLINGSLDSLGPRRTQVRGRISLPDGECSKGALGQGDGCGRSGGREPRRGSARS